MNVVRSVEPGARGICQNTELPSSVVKTLAPAYWASVWSTAGRGCLSRLTLSFSLVRSTQIHTFELLFGTTTMLEHHSVGSMTLAITPNSSILCNSCRTRSRRGIATRRGVERENGSASSHNSIVYFPSNFPSPWKREGNSSFGESSLVGSIDAMRWMS